MDHPYAAEAYVAALARADERAVHVPAWRTAVLARPIAGSGGGMDAAGAYPMAALDPAGDVRAGLDALAAHGLVSLVMVADPLYGPPAERLAAAFDVARPFKTHYLVEPARFQPNKHHRAEIRRSQARCRVERVSLGPLIGDWMRLYSGLVDRHAIGGAAAFSEAYWRHLAASPVLETFTAYVDDEVVAMGLWLRHDGVGYNHLGASSAAGYAAGASYAVYAAAIEHHGGCAVLNLGGGAGRLDDPSDGLARFKRGFSTATATAHLYGAVLDPERYAALAGGTEADFFPAYRG